VDYRDECRAMWLASKRGTATDDEGEAAQEHSTGAPSAESAAEGHGLGISDSSASEDMLEVSTDSDSDWRNDTDTTDSESEAPQALRPPLLAPDELCIYPERTFGSGQGALIAMATPVNEAFHKPTEAERANHSAGNLHLAKYFAVRRSGYAHSSISAWENSMRTPEQRKETRAHTTGMAGPGNDPVQVFRTKLRLHWDFLRLWTGFELPSSWSNLPCYGVNRKRNILDFMRWPQIDLGAQDLNDIQRPNSFQTNSWK
jgi:hypothetical protein